MAHHQKQSRQLRDAGYTVVERAFNTREVRQFQHAVTQLLDREGDSAGAEFRLEAGCRRLANLVNKSPCFRDLIVDERVLCWVREVLGESWKLSSLNSRTVLPGSEIRQPLHADMGAVPDASGDWVCNVIVLLDDVDGRNGPIRIVPGSHRWNRLPQDGLDDPLAPHPDEVQVTGVAGSLIVLNAHVWHGGLPNRTRSPRTALHVFYTRRDKPQQQYQKQLLNPDVIDSLCALQRHVLAIDDPVNDRLCSAQTRGSGFLKD